MNPNIRLSAIQPVSPVQMVRPRTSPLPKGQRRVEKHKRGWALVEIVHFMGKVTKTVLSVHTKKADAEALL